MSEHLFWFCIFVIFYAYAGYPILLTVIARLFPTPVNYAPLEPSVTLVIPAFNEEKVIKSKLENCLELNYPRERLDILVVTDGSTDQTADIVIHYQNSGVRLLHHPERRGKIGAINNAMPHINSDIAVFSDANNMYEKEALKELVAPFSDDRVGAVSGAKTILKGDGLHGERELYKSGRRNLCHQEEFINTVSRENHK